MLSGLENPVHLLMVFAAILLLFGAKRLPELGRSLGTGLREFKTSVTGATETSDQVSSSTIEPGTTPSELN